MIAADNGKVYYHAMAQIQRCRIYQNADPSIDRNVVIYSEVHTMGVTAHSAGVSLWQSMSQK